MAELRIPIIGEFKGQKAFKDAGKATSTLDKSVKRLGSTLAATFGATQLLKFAKNAAKAFIEDEKAATRLAISVKNLGLAFETPRIEEFIAQLSRASGVTDDELRPSMQKLLQTTGSVSKSTELLTQALDISRGSGVEFSTVVSDLTSAYVGQTRGLRKYSLGLSVAELKTMKFSDVQEKLNKQFSGANAAYLDTYAGKMQILGTAAGEAQEIIGKGLVDALMILSGDSTVEELADTMLELADNTAVALQNLAKFGKGVQDTVGPLATVLEKFINVTQPFFNSIVFGDPLTFTKQPPAAERMGGYPSSALGGTFIDPNDAARKKAEADAAKRAKELAALQKKTLDTQKKSLALQKASKTLNLEAIGIEAALKGSISETDRLSLLLQKSILEGNATLATQLSDQLEAAIKRNNELRLALLATPKAPNPYEDWKIPDDILNYTAKSLGVSPETVISAPQNIPMQATDAGEEVRLAALAAMDAQAKAEAAQAAADAAAVYVKITLPDGTDMTSQAKTELTNQALSGSFVNVNRLGRFANTPVAL